MLTVYTHNFAPGAYLVSGQNNVNPASAAEIHHHVTGLKLRETGGAAAAPGEIKDCFGDQSKLLLGIEPLADCMARTGPGPAGSAVLFITPVFREIAVATLDHLLNLLGPHYPSLLLASRAGFPITANAKPTAGLENGSWGLAPASYPCQYSLAARRLLLMP